MRLLNCHRNAHALLGRDEVIEIHGFFAEVELDPVHLAAEFLPRRPEVDPVPRDRRKS